jgi:hypothetical protein
MALALYSSFRPFIILKLQKQSRQLNFSTGAGTVADIPTMIENLIFFEKI